MRWNLADELARRRAPGKPRAAAASARSGDRGAGRTRPTALPDVSDTWRLPPTWPLDGWRAAAFGRACRLAAEASRWPPRWPRRRRLIASLAAGVLAVVATACWRTEIAAAPTRSSATGATVVAPAAAAIKPRLAPLPAATLTVAPAPLPDPAGRRLLANVSTMDLLMTIAEPDLDIRSGQSLWAQVGKSSDVDPLLLYSIALVESKALDATGKMVPTPWLFRVNDRVVRGDRHDVQLAMAAASQFGSAVQDVGIMQVYYPMHRDVVRDPLALLNPRTNITVAAKILRQGMQQTSDHVLGVGYYHSHTPERARDYGTLVLAVYKRLKAIYRPATRQQSVAG